MQAGYATEKKDTREAVAAMNATQKNASDYFQELEKQRAAVVEAQQDRDKYFKDLVQKDDELNQAKNDLRATPQAERGPRQGPRQVQGTRPLDSAPRARTATIRARCRRRSTAS